MSRPVSPLLHDYKSSAKPRSRKPKAVQWFAVGLGLPLVGIALLLSRDDVAGTAVPPVADISDEVVVAEPSVSLGIDGPFQVVAGTATLVSPSSFHPPLMLPEPEYDRITWTISSGDTLEGLFRKHKISLGHLAEIVRLPDESDSLRILKRGRELADQSGGGNPTRR